MFKDLLGIKEVSQSLGFSISAVRSLIRNKQLKAVILNGKWVMHKEELLRFEKELLKQLKVYERGLKHE